MARPAMVGLLFKISVRHKGSGEKCVWGAVNGDFSAKAAAMGGVVGFALLIWAVLSRGFVVFG